MTQQNKVPRHVADKMVSNVIGEANDPVFATRPVEAGDICLILRAGGGLEILSFMGPDMKDSRGVVMEPADVSTRGTFALALMKLALQRDVMAIAVSDVLAQTMEPGQGRLDA